MKKLIFALFLACNLAAQSLDTLVSLAYAHDPKLLQLQEEVKLSHEDILAADLWENPILQAGLSDIRLDDITNRSLEPMQTNFIAISQKIPLSDKLAFSKELFAYKEKIAHYRVENEKRKILSDITRYAYRTVIAQKQLALIAKNQKNLIQIKKLLRGYRASEDLLLDVDQMLLALQTRKEMLLAGKKNDLQQISRHTLQQIQSVQLSLKMIDTEIKTVQTHPLLAMYRLDTEAAKKAIDIAAAKQIPDVTLRGGYYQRAGREDYLNLSVSVPLQVRGREKAALQKARIMFSRQQQRYQDVTNRFENDVKLLAIKMQKSRRTYRLYQKKILPKQKRIGAYLRAQHRTGALTMVKWIENTDKVITLEEKALDEMGLYFDAYARLRYYR